MTAETFDRADPGDEVRLFDPPPARRRWSAGDVIRLLIGLGVLVLGVVAASYADGTIAGVESDLIDGIDRIPDQVEQILLGTAQITATLVPLAALGLILWKRRWRLLATLWISSLVAGGATTALTNWLDDRQASTTIAVRTASDSLLVAADFPTTEYLGSAVAMVVVGAAHVPRRWKRALWWWVVVLLVLRLLGPGQPPLDVWIAVATGLVIGSIALMVAGSPNPEPSPDDILAALRVVGLDPSAVTRRDDSNAHATYLTDERSGPGRFVKLRTPDDRKWDLLARTYRAIRLRSSEVGRPFSTLKRRVEHEALAVRTARDAGVRAPHVIGIGRTAGDAVLLVEDRISGRRLSDLGTEDLTDDLIRSVFREVRSMHAARMAHHGLSLDNMLVDDHGDVWLVDFDEAELAADPRERSRDVAGLLAAVGALVGPERAVTLALEVLGDDPVAASLPLLQPLALNRTLERSAKRERGLLDALRREIHERTGVDDVPLERLARVQPRTLLMIVAGALAFYSLLPQFGNLGDTVDAFGDANWAWLPAVLAASVLYFVFATVSFLGSVAQPMPVAASARGQIASAFATLVGPAGAGKMALAGRFLQRNGLTSAEASASVALNSIAGVGTHLALMAAFFGWAGGADVGGVSLPGARTVLLVVAIVVGVIAVASLFPIVRRQVIRPVIDGLRTAAGYVAQVVRSPVRVVGLLGGSSCITLSYLFALVFCVEAFGGGLSVAQIGAAYLGAAAIANIAPTPGGIGPLEAAMIAALTGFGLDAGTAISSVLTFRLATFWLPILPGWATFLYMERRGEI